jgi:drug/metabolite transporter (DMT)-like permease
MILILLVYALFASTFTLGKAALSYCPPVFFIGVRMTLAGIVLACIARFSKQWRPIDPKSIPYLVHIILFHIYCAYVLEFWALARVSSIKVALVYNLSPFVTALLSYFLLQDSLNRMNRQKWIGLLIGFAAMVPWIFSDDTGRAELVHGISLSEFALFGSVVSAAFGWIVMRLLIERFRYSPIFINSIGMLGGGILALATSFWIEGAPWLLIPEEYGFFARTYLLPVWGTQGTSFLLFLFYLTALLVIANGICYNLYGYLLQRYSATFLSFAGFTCPLFAALFGWLFHGETISFSLLLTMIFIFIGLSIFYRHELAYQRNRV